MRKSVDAAGVKNSGSVTSHTFYITSKKNSLQALYRNDLSHKLINRLPRYLIR